MESPYHFQPLSAYGLDRAADLLSQSFADYFVKISFSADSLLQAARADSVDLTTSRIVLCDGDAIGAALVARRGWTTRLAAMACLPGARRRGAGRATVGYLLNEAAARGDRRVVLEVIEQNEPAVKLYQRCGFQTCRRLIGLAGPGRHEAAPPAGLEEMDVRSMAALVAAHFPSDFPWQLSGETLAHLSPPGVAYRLDGVWIALSNLDRAQVAIRGLVDDRATLHPRRVAALLRAVMAKHPGKEWRLTAIWPEELSSVWAESNLSRLPLSQWQMSRELSSPPLPC